MTSWFLGRREHQSGNCRLFARSTAVDSYFMQDSNYEAWHYNAYTGTVYEVLAECPPIGQESHSGCMVQVPPRDTLDRPMVLDLYASGSP